MRRQKELDAAKGLAIIITMFSHSCGIPYISKLLYGFFLPINEQI